jgi:hypothetical protein
MQSQIEDGMETLKVQHNIIIEDFDPAVFRRQLTGDQNCTELELRNHTSGAASDCWNTFTKESFGEMLSPYITLTNEAVLTLLLCLYLLSARSLRNEFDHHRAVHSRGELLLMERIELMNRNYVVLKTKLSALTAALCAAILLVCNVKLWSIWGCLTFILNFIPNVGSLIAMVLPLPIIFVDQELGPLQKCSAVAGVILVQAYVGNVLEPQVFGKSLNLTPLSVLVGLVMWTAVWGLCGAILSVPMLGVMKIMLDAADYPMAKHLLSVIREDATVDEGAEMRKAVQKLAGWKLENRYAVHGGARSGGRSGSAGHKKSDGGDTGYTDMESQQMANPLKREVDHAMALGHTLPSGAMQ